MIDNPDKAEALLNALAEGMEDPDFELVSIQATRKRDGVTVWLVALAKEQDGGTHLLPLAEFIDMNDYVADRDLDVPGQLNS